MIPKPLCVSLAIALTSWRTPNSGSKIQAVALARGTRSSERSQRVNTVATGIWQSKPLGS